MAYAYVALHIFGADDQALALYTLDGTHYGKLLPIFTQQSGELDRFKTYALRTVRPGYKIKTLAIIGDNLDQVLATLQERDLLPSGRSRVAVEGTPFFDEVIAQLITDTIWKE